MNRRTDTYSGIGSAVYKHDQLETVLENGVLRRDQTLDEIRAIASSYDAYEKKVQSA